MRITSTAFISFVAVSIVHGEASLVLVGRTTDRFFEWLVLIMDMTSPVLRVLVVDDFPDVAGWLGRLLQSAGCEVQVFTDSEEALSAALLNPPDVALLDIGLPKIDGYSLAIKLREALPGRALLLVAVTAYGSPEDHDRACRSGFNCHFTKPTNPASLIRLLEAYQQLRQSVPEELLAQHVAEAVPELSLSP
jgi:CheY-like chemotaxis protein